MADYTGKSIEELNKLLEEKIEENRDLEDLAGDPDIDDVISENKKEITIINDMLLEDKSSDIDEMMVNEPIPVVKEDVEPIQKEVDEEDDFDDIIDDIKIKQEVSDNIFEEEKEDESQFEEDLSTNNMNISDEVFDLSDVIKNTSYESGGKTDEVIMIKIGGDKKYPYYIKKIDTTHIAMANNKDGVDLVVPSHILQHKGESYYDDVRSWLKGGTSPNGKSYDSDYYAQGGQTRGSGARMSIDFIKETRKVGDFVRVETDILGKEELTGEIESFSPLKIRTDATSVVVIPNESIKYLYAEGGMIDYFEEYELLQKEYPKIYEVVFEQGELTDYNDTERLLNKLNSMGWTFDYGLDNSPYDLRPFAPKVNMPNYKDYAKGGKIGGLIKQLEKIDKESEEHQPEEGYIENSEAVEFILDKTKLDEEKVDEMVSVAGDMKHEGYINIYDVRDIIEGVDRSDNTKGGGIKKEAEKILEQSDFKKQKNGSWELRYYDNNDNKRVDVVEFDKNGNVVKYSVFLNTPDDISHKIDFKRIDDFKKYFKVFYPEDEVKREADFAKGGKISYDDVKERVLDNYGYSVQDFHKGMMSRQEATQIMRETNELYLKLSKPQREDLGMLEYAKGGMAEVCSKCGGEGEVEIKNNFDDGRGDYVWEDCDECDNAKGGTLDKLGINSLDLGKLKKQITKEGKSLKKTGKKSVVGYTSIDNHIKYAFKKSDEYINGSEGTKESRLSNAIFTLTEALEEMKEEKKLLYKIEIKEAITGDGRKFYFQERNPKDFQDEIADIISENNDMSVEYVDIFSYKKDKEDEAEYRGNLVYENKKKKNTSKKLKSSIKKELKDYSDDNNLIDYYSTRNVLQEYLTDISERELDKIMNDLETDYLVEPLDGTNDEYFNIGDVENKYKEIMYNYEKGGEVEDKYEILVYSDGKFEKPTRVFSGKKLPYAISKFKEIRSENRRKNDVTFLKNNERLGHYDSEDDPLENEEYTKGGETDDLGNPTDVAIVDKMEVFIEKEIPKLDENRYFTEGMKRKEAKKRFYEKYEYGAYNPKFSFDFESGGGIHNIEIYSDKLRRGYTVVIDGSVFEMNDNTMINMDLNSYIGERNEYPSDVSHWGEKISFDSLPMVVKDKITNRKSSSFSKGGEIELKYEVELIENATVNRKRMYVIVNKQNFDDLEKLKYAGGFKRFSMDLYTDDSQKSLTNVNEIESFLNSIGISPQLEFAEGGEIQDMIDGLNDMLNELPGDTDITNEIEVLKKLL